MRGAALSCLLLALLLVVPSAQAAGGKHKPKRSKSPLVYLFVLDGLDRDAVTAEGDAPFLSNLIAGEGAHSVFFPDSRSVMVAETNPNHTSMITGAYPETHGIVGNAFATPGAGPDGDSCPANPGGPPTVTSGESSDCVQAENAFTALERQAPDNRFTTAFITGKPKLARLFASETVNPGTYDADYIWAPCDDDEIYCHPDVPTDPISGYSSSVSVMDEVIRTTREGIGDKGVQRLPDFTFVNLPAIDGAGHTYGRSSSNYAAAVAEGGDLIERFVDNQRQLGIWRRTVMIVVSDHGMDDTPQTSKISVQALLTANGISPSDYAIVGNGGAAHIYLTDRGAVGAPDLLARMRTALIASPSIDEARYLSPNPADGGEANTIAAANPPWFLGGENSGDIVISTVPGVGVLEASSASAAPFNPLQGNHGSTFTRDNFWLIAGGGRVVRDRPAGFPVSNASAAPTALRVLGADPPADAEAESMTRQAFRAKYLKRRSGR